MTLIKLCGAAVFAAAVLVGVGLLLTRPGLYYFAIGLSGAALIVVLLSALPWRSTGRLAGRRRTSRY